MISDQQNTTAIKGPSPVLMIRSPNRAQKVMNNDKENKDLNGQQGNRELTITRTFNNGSGQLIGHAKKIPHSIGNADIIQDPVAHLRALLGRDVVLLPIPKGEKGPKLKEWQKTRHEVMEDPAYLGRLQQGNIGVLLGKVSGDLCAIDIDDEKLAFAEKIDAVAGINAKETTDVPDAVKTLSGGGTHLSVDALGSRETCRNAILGLRKRGRHVQLGLLLGREANPEIPMGAVISNELEIIGSHGMQAHQYPSMLQLIAAGKLRPELMLGKTVDLEAGARALMDLDGFRNLGVTVIGL